MKPSLALAALLCLTLSPAVHAETYVQSPAQPAVIQFVYQQMGVKMDGQFKRAATRLSFDPARPASAQATIEVDLAGIDLGSREADQEAAGKPWFDSRSFPTARFVSSGVKPLGGSRYEVTGTLSLKGRSRELVVPATFTGQGANGVFEGSFTLRRGDFGIGEGAWSKFDIVANDVQVRFRIPATRK